MTIRVRRTLWIVTLTIASVLALAGCSDQKDAAERESPDRPVVIRFWHMDDSGLRKESTERIIADFNARHEGEIRVEALGVNFWDYWDKIAVSIAAMEEPDVFLNDLGNVGMRAATGAIADLDSYLADAGIDPDATYFDAPLEMARFEGSVYALPYETDVRLLFYNKQMFAEVGLDPEQPPSSWQELQESAHALSIRFDRGTYDRLGFNPLLPQSYFLTYVWGTGADYLDDAGNIVVNSAEVVAALTQWNALIETYGREELQKFASEFGGGAADPFIVEKLAMTIQVPDFYSQIKRYNPDLDFGYTQVPYPAGPTSWSNGFSLELSIRSDHPQEAFTFMSYLMSREVQLERARTASVLVTNAEAATDPQLMEDPFWRETVATLEHTHFRPFVLAAPMWYEHMNRSVEEVVFGRKGPQEALDHAQRMIHNDITKFEMTR